MPDFIDAAGPPVRFVHSDLSIRTHGSRPIHPGLIHPDPLIRGREAGRRLGDQTPA